MRAMPGWTITCVGLFCAAGAIAQGPLGSDPTGIPGFTGMVAFNASNQLLIDLDFAVFEPGVYPDNGVNGFDPSHGSEYVYAYQAFNVSPSASLITTSVGLLPDNGAGNAIGDPLHVMTGGLAPTTTEVNQVSLSVITRFLSPPLPAQGFSTVFLFTSPNPPTFMFTSVQSGGLGDTQMAPSPTPEPSTLALLGAAGLLALRRRRSPMCQLQN